MQPDRLWHDKIHYVASVVRRGQNKVRVITPRMVECVLRHPPSRPTRLTKAEENRINSKLISPLHAEIILQILEAAKDYDRKIVRHTDKARQENESNPPYYSPLDRIAV
jgi:hypothetical protein